MTFPTNPTNGQSVTLNGVEYTYNSTKTAWLKTTSGSGTVPATVSGTLTVTGNANVGNLGTAGLIVATGNITGGNLITGGTLTVTGNANVGNLGTAAISSTANVTTSARYIKTSTGGLAGGASGNITRYGTLTTSSVGDIHITTSSSGNASVALNYGLTFGVAAGTTQSAIIISENGTDGTGIGLYTTNSYATGPQLRMSIESNGNILPGGNVTQNLGSSTLRWSTIFTGDLDLSNGIGDWTIVEGEEDLFIYNNKKGKVYKFALIEVDPATAPPKKEN